MLPKEDNFHTVTFCITCQINSHNSEEKNCYRRQSLFNYAKDNKIVSRKAYEGKQFYTLYILIFSDHFKAAKFSAPVFTSHVTVMKLLCVKKKKKFYSM